MKRSESYVGTVDHRTPEGQAAISDIRDRVACGNLMKKLIGVDKRYRVILRGRLGANNPAYADYKAGRKTRSCIRLEDAVRVDIYVCERRKGE